jgi:hypothetical protein
MIVSNKVGPVFSRIKMLKGLVSFKVLKQRGIIMNSLNRIIFIQKR